MALEWLKKPFNRRVKNDIEKFPRFYVNCKNAKMAVISCDNACSKISKCVAHNLRKEKPQEH